MSGLLRSERAEDKKLTAVIDRVIAAAPACAHAAACITPDTEVKLTLILSSLCKLAAAAMPASVAGIYGSHARTHFRT